ncbi:unnamed protein product [Bursaphelenchus xylophilus]|uniref:(pine wood nematode) hypothetical protein n=1 Tax=Bursaphelenchus xylophilus TaxID=6326 RepID=A0A1I7SFH3_BURXY|nr:unnamed protein product [Bursaphelenchus xylophilus]CAG9079011.1 unnamed protein product [Bursaphelenchus xylophilus]
MGFKLMSLVLVIFLAIGVEAGPDQCDAKLRDPKISAQMDGICDACAAFFPDEPDFAAGCKSSCHENENRARCVAHVQRRLKELSPVKAKLLAARSVVFLSAREFVCSSSVFPCSPAMDFKLIALFLALCLAVAVAKPNKALKLKQFQMEDVDPKDCHGKLEGHEEDHMYMLRACFNCGLFFRDDIEFFHRCVQNCFDNDDVTVCFNNLRENHQLDDK